MNTKIAQLVVNPTGKGEIVSRIFLSQPGMEEEQLLGKLFILLELKNKKADTLKLVNFIIDRLTVFYYQNEQIPLLTRLATLTVSDIFESALAKLNQEVGNFLTAEKIKFLPQTLDLTVGVIFKNKLFFATHGHNKALLIYKPKVKNNRQVNDYNLTNISQQAVDPNQEIFNPHKLFTFTTGGSLPADGYFVFTNEALFEFLSEKQLIKIITTLPPAGASQQIKNLLEQTNIYVPFVGLIINNQQVTKTAEDGRVVFTDPRVKAQPSPVYHQLEASRYRQNLHQERDLNKESIRALNRTAQKTAQILMPSGLLNLDKIKRLAGRLNLNRWRPNQGKLLLGRQELTSLKRGGLISLKKIGNGLRSSLLIGWRIITWLLALLRDRQRRQEAKQTIAGFKSRLTRRHLIALGVAAICLVALIISLIYAGSQRSKHLKETAWQAAKEQFEQKEKQVAADLLYDNKSKAQLSLDEMTLLLNDLTTNVLPKHQAELAQIKERYQKNLDTISGITRLTAPEKLATLSGSGQLGGLAWSNNQLFFVDAGANTVNKLNPTNRETGVVSNALPPNLILANADKQGTVYYRAANKIIAVASSSQTKIRTVDQLPADVRAANVYNNKLYLFDAATRQIYRYNQSGTGFVSQTPWLQEPYDADTASALAIDTSVYLLVQNQVLKYDGGSRQPFALDNVYPPLTKPSRLIAPLNDDSFYLLDPDNRRLVVFGRSGKLLKQFASDAFDRLTDLAVDAGSKTAYLLNGNDIYKVNLK